MKLNRKNRPALFILLALLLLSGCAAGFGVYQTTIGASLSQAQIAELRETYPICGDDNKIPQVIEKSGKNPTWEEIKERSDTFVYATVDGEWTTYQRFIYDWYEYPITVIEDTEGFFQPGEKLSIASNLALIEYNPDFRPGMKIFFPVMLESQEGTRLDFSVEGTYYVTEDEHVLSAFDEDKIAMEKKMTGKKLSVLMQDVKK